MTVTIVCKQRGQGGYFRRVFSADSNLQWLNCSIGAPPNRHANYFHFISKIHVSPTEVIELDEISRLTPTTTESRTEDHGRLLPVLKRTANDDDCQGTSAVISSNRGQNEKQSQGIGKIVAHVDRRRIGSMSALELAITLPP